MQKFDDTPNFLEHWRDAHQIFRHSDTKNLLLTKKHKIFRYPNFFETMKGCSRNSSAMWDQKFSTEKRDTAIMHEFFRYHNFSGKQKGSFTKLFVSILWDKKFRQNRDAPPPPAHMHEKFWNKKFFETQICSAMRILAMWDKKFSKENRDNSPLSSIKCFPLPKNIETQNGLLAKFFRSCEIKETFDKTLKLPPLLLEKFRFQNSFETQKCSPRKFINLSALWDKNFSKEFSDIPLLCINSCDTRNFLKHRTVPQRKFLVVWQKFSTEKRDTPSLSGA